MLTKTVEQSADQVKPRVLATWIDRDDDTNATVILADGSKQRVKLTPAELQATWDGWADEVQQ